MKSEENSTNQESQVFLRGQEDPEVPGGHLIQVIQVNQEFQMIQGFLENEEMLVKISYPIRSTSSFPSIAI